MLRAAGAVAAVARSDAASSRRSQAGGRSVAGSMLPPPARRCNARASSSAAAVAEALSVRAADRWSTATWHPSTATSRPSFRATSVTAICDRRSCTSQNPAADGAESPRRSAHTPCRARRCCQRSSSPCARQTTTSSPSASAGGSIGNGLRSTGGGAPRSRRRCARRRGGTARSHLATRTRARRPAGSATAIPTRSTAPDPSIAASARASHSVTAVAELTATTARRGAALPAQFTPSRCPYDPDKQIPQDDAQAPGGTSRHGFHRPVDRAVHGSAACERLCRRPGAGRRRGHDRRRRLRQGAGGRAFEEAFAAYCGVRECVGVASGLDALRLALIALGLERGDEVIVPANTFIATVEAVSQAGASPGPGRRRASATTTSIPTRSRPRSDRVRACVVPVHLYGQMADMRRIARRSPTRHGLPLIEDACQAHGAVRDGLRAGSAGTPRRFSFYPGKNLGAMGDAGALVDRRRRARRARPRAARARRSARSTEHGVEGYTARLDTIQAIVLLPQAAAARRLERRSGGRSPARTPTRSRASATCARRRCRRAASRSGTSTSSGRPAPDGAARRTSPARGIGTGRHYPEPPHLSERLRCARATRAGVPGRRALSRARCSRSRSSRASPRRGRAVVDAVKEYFAHGV